QAAHGGAAGGVLGTGSSNVGQGVPPPIIKPDAIAGGRAPASDDVRVFGIELGTDPSPANRDGLARESTSTRKTIERLVTALLVTVGMSFAIGLTFERSLMPLPAVATFLHVISMVGGILLGTYLVAERFHIEGDWGRRFVVAGIAGAGLIPSSLIASAMGITGGERWLLVLFAALIVCDWTGRLRDAQRGEISLGRAIKAGLFGVVAGLVMAHDHSAPAIGAICALTSLVLQTIGGMWPMRYVSQVGAVAGEGSGTATWDGGDATIPASDRPGVAVSPESARDAAPIVVKAQGERAAAQSIDAEVGLLRNPGVRSIWLLISVLVLALSSLLFIASGLVADSYSEVGAFVVAGIVSSQAFLFALSCAVPRYKKGLWRSVFRKAIFFAGIALSGASGASIGLFGLQQEELMFGLTGVIVGGLIGIFVWFVPVPAWQPPKAKPEGEEEANRQRKAKHLKTAGGIGLGIGVMLVPVLLAVVPESDWEELLPAVLIPLGGLGIVFLSIGFAYGRRRPLDRLKARKIVLPIRRIFEVDAGMNLAGLIERHMTMMGFKLDSKSDLLWSFVRGNWSGSFWQSDIREWKTKLNVAAYELDTGGYRVTAFLNVDAPFNSPNRKQIEAVNIEVSDLIELLGGREAARDTEGDAA
ncbi:MAG: hypothetical protein O7B26_02750, partial [Planctomycetota bacterium]|nr:hypothetical protein [Planctomycetota bacterium]